MLNQDTLRAATRLTRTGQLTEATALLQRMFSGEHPPTTAPDQGLLRLPNGASSTIDLQANRIGAADRNAAAVTMRRNRPLFNRAKNGAWLGLRDAKLASISISDILPEGSKSFDGNYTNESGSRTYKLFVPSSYDKGHPLPLVVMLHGCTQSPDDFAAGTRMNFIAEEQQCLVVYPEQPRSANSSKCWNWFRAADQRRDEGEPSLIAGITRQVMRDYAVDAKRVFIAGLSAGGAAAAIMGTTYSDLYAAVGIHSGLPYGAAADMPSAFTAMRQGSRGGRQALAVPTIVFHGDRDATVHPDNGRHIIEQVLAGSSTLKSVHRGQIPGGHQYTRTTYGEEQREVLEHWNIHGASHAWSGGSAAGSYTDGEGPDATKEMLRFFLAHPQV